MSPKPIGTEHAPYPSPSFHKQVSEAGLAQIHAEISGEMTATRTIVLMGPAPRFSGKVVDSWMSVIQSGDAADNDQLRLSGEVRINGTSIFTTRPSIGDVSGETSQQKTTVVAGDTNITQGVIDHTNNSFNAGDVFEAEFFLDRTGSPGTEIQNPIIVVELEPDI